MIFINSDMGCNCSKDTIPLSLRQKIRRETKEKIAEVKRLWRESADNITVDKDTLGFKEINRTMIKKFEEYIRDREKITERTDPEKKTTHDGKEIAGIKEVIEIEGLGKMKAKLDSGNTAMNALIVADYYENREDRTVKFDFNGEEKVYDVVKHIRIWHHGKSTERPCIRVNIKFNGKEYKDELIDLKISDLTGTKDYRSRLLLCKDFMSRANIVIDPSKEFKITDKKEIKKKKK